MSFDLPRIGVWTGQLELVPASQSQELAAELESLGYGAIWIPEVAGRDVILQLGLLLSATTRMLGASGIASIYARDPITMTGGLRGLTEAFPDRVLLGLGVSHHTLVEGLRGHDYSKPLAAMSAYLDAMDASPYTSFRPSTPLRRVLAALGPKMLQLAAEKTQGAHSYFVPPEHTVSARAILGSGPLLCVEQAVLLESDPTTARDIARKHTATYVRLPNYANNLRRHGFDDADFENGGSDRLIDAIVAWGDMDTVTSRVRAQLDAGADHVCVQALDPEPRGVPVAQWRELAPALLGVAR
ncbi:LLM class F420-dependent oxidoreductase [Acidiferrimicrobium sp. IK]|uniref:LLM class F420-dependent oxidoreductase n=1 Tax=Acidiferrimicrobium sp. IK TaxID=2871700 RepID=UPI0021CB4539|nr:LLM class F420-dependent oxidoreductase [Acidiferrimicrobium sp. IK]MCU4184042.1 LLM class F420-dependent oxidoreductase [Acidiferrimicrobium sp. IK]